MSDVKYICNGEKILAILVPSGFSAQSIKFFTPPEFSQQMAFMSHPAGKTIDAHVHNRVTRKVYHTNEALFIRKGQVRVDFYDDTHAYLFSDIVGPGDVLLLVSGGHGFEVLDDCEMIEIKQGPYAGDQDKTLIPNVTPEELCRSRGEP